ncbi:uncharacterized protein LY89DRAFT_740272 [Mollisia scopiformis]|uniref:Uncharacterized protein n=1 Tax=Mollisia scopiformis TaxID=149040 RepID=A0A132BFB8_MOLSC|nr:uncharacterized protein LY89DRAFT_740272 [Mollisia scopiformis]KUJ10564.1 hypothetical protein LY89DRAFT_740272 [Mollisia scopiformis]
MPGVHLPSRLGSLRRSEKSKGKQPATGLPSNDLDADCDFDPRVFNPFDQPDMSLTADGRLTKPSRLDPYSIVDSPQQTLTQYLDADLQRRKTLRAAASRSQRNGGEGSSSGPSHRRIRALRTDDGVPGSLNDIQQPPQRGMRPGPVSHRASRSVREGTKDIMSSPQTIRRVSVSRTLGKNEAHIVSPSFHRPMPALLETSGEQLWATAEQILEPRLILPRPMSLNECLESHLQRRTSNRSPDSGVSGVSTTSKEDSKGKSRVGDHRLCKSGQEIDPANISQTDQHLRGRPRTRQRRSKSYSCPTRSSESWLDSTEARRGRPQRRSDDRPRKRDRASSTERYQQWYLKEIQEELHARGRFAVILQRQENLKEELLEGHLQRILDSARRGPDPIYTSELTADLTGAGYDKRRWIRNKIPIRIHDVRQLKAVSSIRWTPKTEATMTSARIADVEETGEVHVKLSDRIKIGWAKFRAKSNQAEIEDDKVHECLVGKHHPKLCQENRLRRQVGAIPGKIC